MGDSSPRICSYSSGIPGMGFGSSTKVVCRMPMGEGVMVVLMESSISEMTIQPSVSAKWVSIAPWGRTAGGSE